MSVGVISGTTWWKVPLLTSRRQHRRWPVSSWAARPVMWTRWQESRQGPLWATRCRAAVVEWQQVGWLAVLLDCCWTVQSSQGASVWSWCKFSVYESVSPSVGHLFLLSLSLSSHFLCDLVSLLLSLFSCFSFSLANCLPSPVSSRLLSKRFWSRWHSLKGGRTLLKPCFLRQGWHPFFLMRKAQ